MTDRPMIDIQRDAIRPGVWMVTWNGQVISTHSTRDGAVVSCNQLRREFAGMRADDD